MHRLAFPVHSSWNPRLAFLRISNLLLTVAGLLLFAAWGNGQSAAQHNSPTEAVILLPSASEPGQAVESADRSPALARAIAHGYRHFGSVHLHQESKAQTYTLAFQSSTTLTGIAAKGDFRVGGGSCIEGHAYAQGDRCSIDVLFAPQGPGNRTGKLIVSHSASVHPLIVPTGGTGYGPAVSFIPAQINTVPSTLNVSAGVLSNPLALAIDGGDALYISDSSNNLVRYIDSSGTLTTIAGGGTTPSNLNPGSGLAAQFNMPVGIATDTLGDVFVADYGNQDVFEIDALDYGFPIIGGGTKDDTNCTFKTPCTNPAQLDLGNPFGLAADPSGNLYGSVGGRPNLFADQTQGLNYPYYRLKTFGLLNQPPLLAADAAGDLYYSFPLGYVSPGLPAVCSIYAQTPAFGEGQGGRYWRVAGSRNCGFSGDGGLATGAEISGIIGGIAFDAAGDLYFSDAGNNRIRRIDANTGVIRTIAGSGVAAFGSAGDGGPATSAPLKAPIGVAVDSRGNVYTTNFYDAASTATIREIGNFGALTFLPQGLAIPSSAQTVLVTNTGNDALNLSYIGIASGNTKDFALDPVTTTCQTTQPLGVGHSCYVGVIFTPSALGARTATLTLGDDTVSGSNQVLLNGTGATPATATLSPATLTYASQNTGTTSAAKTVKLSNTGGATLTIHSITLSGTAAADYAFTTTCGTTLSGGSNCTLSVTFTPTAGGTRAAAIAIATSVGAAGVTLSGTGTKVSAVLAPNSLSFVSQTVGTASFGFQTTTLTNTGTAAITVNSVKFGGADGTDFFDSLQQCTAGLSLAPNGSCTFHIKFDPAATGTRNGVLTVATTSGTPTVTLSGTGVAAAVKSKVTLASSANPVARGRAVVLKSQVLSTVGFGATGKAQLLEGSNVLAEATLKVGVATFSLTHLSPGIHMLTARYLGDAHHAASQSASLRQIVKSAP